MSGLPLSSSEKEEADTEGSNLNYQIFNDSSPVALLKLRPLIFLSALRAAAYRQEFWTETLASYRSLGE